jgi:hypothetical protein
MKVNGVGAGANINMGVVSRPLVGFGDGSEHDNGRRAHGKPDSFRSDFRSLLRAVKSGDMTSAQSALATIQSDVAAASATYSPASTTTPAESPLGADLKALFDAVGSGDATSAQTALAKFVSDRRDAWQPQSVGSDGEASGSVQGHHGRRHYGLESLIASLFSSSTTDAPTTDAPPASSTDTTSPDTPPVDSTTSPDSAGAPETVAA